MNALLTPVQRAVANPDRRRRSLLAVVVLAHLVLAAAAFLVVGFGRPRFLGLFLYVVLGVVVFDLLLLVSRSNTRDRLQTAVAWPVLGLATRWEVAVLALSLAVITLAFEGRGLPFYLLVAAYVVLVILRAIRLDARETAPTSTLVLLSVGSLALISAQVFTVAFFFGTSDSIVHTTVTQTIVDSGGLSGIESTRYYGFPLLHVFSAMATLVTALPARTVIAVELALLFQAALWSIYLFVNRWSGSQTTALVATALVAVNPAFIDFGTKAHYQALSFVFFAVFLFLLFSHPKDRRDVVVTTLVFVAWVGTHHVSVVIALGLIAVPVCVRLVLDRSRPLSRFASRTIALQYATFLFVFTVYWVSITESVQGLITWIFFTSAAASGLESRSYVVRLYTELEPLVVASLPFFVDNLYFGLLLAVAGIGVWVLVTTSLALDARWQVVGVAFLAAAAIYFPNPAWIPLEGVAEFSRWSLMTLPFLLVVPALGVIHLVRRTEGTRLERAVVVVVVFGLVFTSLAAGMTNPSLANVAGFEKDNQRYMTTQELATGDFVLTYAGSDQHVASHSEFGALLQNAAWIREGDTSRREAIGLYDRVWMTDDGRIVLREGLTVFSTAALAGDGVKVQYADRPVSTEAYAATTQFDRMGHSTVYDNDAVVVQYVPTSTTAGR